MSTATSNAFVQRKTFIYACIFLLICLVLFYVTLLGLRATSYLEKHLFDIDSLSSVSQATAVSTQAWTVIVLLTFSHAMQVVSSDIIVRRRQSVAALHDNLMAWRGLGSSILTIWRSRTLEARTRLRVLLTFVFLGAVTILHIITPSVITVGTFSANFPVSLNVSTMPGNIYDFMSSPFSLRDGKTTLNAISYLWPQLATNVGLPGGVNGSVLFSTLQSTTSEDVVFIDPHAHDLSVRCGIIPRVPGDTFNVLYTGPGDNHTFPTRISLSFDITPGFEPYPGNMKWYQNFPFAPEISMSAGFFALGGNKQSTKAPPVFWFNDIFMNLPPKDNEPNNSSAVAFAYISTRNDSLKLDNSIGFLPPVQLTLQARTWSFVNNDTNNAFLEDVNATFYIWPIGCSLFVQNTTAKVRGDNTLLWKDSLPAPTVTRTPFIRQYMPRDPLEIAWVQLIFEIYIRDVMSLTTTTTHTQLSFTSFELQLSSGLNSTGNSLALLGDRLITMTSLSIALVVQHWRTVSLTSDPTLNESWSPVFSTVSGTSSIVMAGLVVHTLPLAIGFATCAILIFVFVTVARRRQSSDNIIRDGRVINMVSLLHGSALPGIISDGNEDVQDLRRIRAVHTHVIYDGHTLDIDGIRQRRHHSASSAIPLRTLTSGSESRQERPSSRDFLLGTSSISLFPEWDESAQILQYRKTKHWFFIGLRPYFIVYLVSIALLTSFYLVLIVLWCTSVFDRNLFDIKRLGEVNQIVSVLTQAWTVGIIAVITFTVQAIASDLAIRRRQTVAALHDILGSWLGLVYATIALFRSRDRLQTRLRLVLALIFFISISILHISTPSVITVRAVNSTVPFSSPVIKMPGNLAHISASKQSRDDLHFAIRAIPYLWEQRDAGIGLPQGYDGSTLFSTSATPMQSDAIFKDPYARMITAQCGSIADSNLNVFDIMYNRGDPAYSFVPYPDTLYFDVRTAFLTSKKTPMKFASRITTIQTVSGDFVFGGQKESVDAPPNYWMNDVLIYLPQDQTNASVQLYSMGTTAFAFISLRPDAFRLNSASGGIPTRAARTFRFDVWGYIGNASLSPFLDPLNITFYIWPIVCSLSAHNVTAWVRGGNRLETTNTNTTLANLTTPSTKSSAPSDPMVTSWSYILDLMFWWQVNNSAIADTSEENTEFTLLEQNLNQTWSLTSLEDRLSNFATFYYSILVQHWRSSAISGDSTGSQWWSEARGSVEGSHLLLSGQLQLSGTQLILGCGCVLALINASAISMFGLRIQPGSVTDGGVIDMISLLRDSSLPAIIAGNDEDDERGDGRRRRAERTMVFLPRSQNWILDVPYQPEPEPRPVDTWEREIIG